MNDTLAMRQARHHLQNYSRESDSLMARHAEAMECWDCDAFLQLGIEAFRWIERVQEETRTSIKAGRVASDARIDACIEGLYREWLGLADSALTWANTQADRNYELANREEFMACVERAGRIVADRAELAAIEARVAALDLEVLIPPRARDL